MEAEKQVRDSHFGSGDTLRRTRGSSMPAGRERMQNSHVAKRFLVSVHDVVSGESLAELHHSGAARTIRAGLTSSQLLFLAAVLARSGQVVR